MTFFRHAEGRKDQPYFAEVIWIRSSGTWFGDMNLAAAKLARAAADAHAAATGQPRFVVGAVRPMPVTTSISPDVNDAGFPPANFAQLCVATGEQIEALLDGGVDVLLVETIFDTLNAKAALFTIEGSLLTVASGCR